jgi:hypothetical protein
VHDPLEAVPERQQIAGAAHRPFREDLPKLFALLDKIETRDPAVILERARLAIYDGDYDGAGALLSNAGLSHNNSAAELLGIADACGVEQLAARDRLCRHHR